MLPEDHVLNDDAETALEVTICGRPRELISQAELRLGLGWSTTNHLHLAGNDHPAKRVSPNMNAATEPPREEIGDRRLARSHETRDPVDAPPGFTHAVHPRDGRRTPPPAALKFAQNTTTERSPERPGRTAISALPCARWRSERHIRMLNGRAIGLWGDSRYQQPRARGTDCEGPEDRLAGRTSSTECPSPGTPG